MPKPRKAIPQLSKGVVRIISGKYRGRKLPVLLAEGLRPTTDRVKETLFNWLMHDVANRACLDCFAGAGSLGFEAISRGASSTTFVEKQRDVAAQLKKNIQILNESTAIVHIGDCLSFLKQDHHRYDLVFIDPPFRQDLVSKTARQLIDCNCLNYGALIYVECEKELGADGLPNNWQLLKEKTAGQVSYRLYKHL